MFRGSSYSMETERDLSQSNVNEENIKIALVGISEVGKSSIINGMEVIQGLLRDKNLMKTLSLLLHSN